MSVRRCVYMYTYVHLHTCIYQHVLEIYTCTYTDYLQVLVLYTSTTNTWMQPSSCQVLSFARLEGTQHVLFICFEEGLL